MAQQEEKLEEEKPNYEEEKEDSGKQKSDEAEGKKKGKKHDYTATHIKILRDLEAVRKRPAMYIGSTGPQGLHHLIWEIVDNAVDEALAGFCDKITVKILEDGSCEVEDNGRGIPIDIHPEVGVPAVEVVFTKLHAGGKFEKGAYKVSGGLHGVGAAVVNALSEKLEVWVKRDGKLVYQRFKRGKPASELKVKSDGVSETGTRVRFKPDPEIFETTEFDYNTVRDRLREISYIVPGLKIVLQDKREGKKETFYSKDGVQGLVKEIVKGSQLLFRHPIYIEGEKEDIKVKSALIYRAERDEILLSFVNTIRTAEGGTHVTGFKSALTKAINQFAEKVLKKKVVFSGDDIRDGLVCSISVFVPEPQFEGQTKTKLGNTKVKNIVESITYEKLMKFFEENPKVVEAIVKRAYEARLEREAEKKARDIVRKKIKEGTVLPGKLADCQIKNPEKTEIFIVEGESAGGSAKQARDRKFQAILPIRGKILNVEKASVLKMLKHEEIQAIISSLGCGFGKECSPDKLRYSKIIILSDADIDGSHIKTLLLTFFWRYMKPLVEGGHIFVAQPPLYRVREKSEDIYLRDDGELKEYVIKRGLRKVLKEYDVLDTKKDGKPQKEKEIEKLIGKIAKLILKGKTDELKILPELKKVFEKIKPEKFSEVVEEKGKEGLIVQRFKGLGEMNPSQLWETTMNPSTRTLKLVRVEDAQRADELFQVLMGENVEQRRDFIVRHALEAEMLDI